MEENLREKQLEEKVCIEVNKEQEIIYSFLATDITNGSMPVFKDISNQIQRFMTKISTSGNDDAKVRNGITMSLKKLIAMIKACDEEASNISQNEEIKGIISTKKKLLVNNVIDKTNSYDSRKANFAIASHIVEHVERFLLDTFTESMAEVYRGVELASKIKDRIYVKYLESEYFYSLIDLLEKQDQWFEYEVGQTIRENSKKQEEPQVEQCDDIFNILMNGSLSAV